MRPSRQAKKLLPRLGAEIPHQRQRRGKSQDALAGEAGVHRHVIGRTERGTYNPSVLTLKAIAAGLGLSIAELFKGAAKR